MQETVGKELDSVCSDYYKESVAYKLDHDSNREWHYVKDEWRVATNKENYFCNSGKDFIQKVTGRMRRTSS